MSNVVPIRPKREDRPPERCATDAVAFPALAQIERAGSWMTRATPLFQRY
jgi:hypothetical protein